MSDKENKLKTFFSKMKINFENQMQNIAGCKKQFIWTVILTFIVMGITCLAVFFASVQGAEKVMVPNVVGKNLTEAILEMGEKELYPKLILKYSDDINDAGKVLEQNPPAGSIVKAYRRMTLTVSRGISLEEIEDYVGKPIDETLKRLDVLYRGEYANVKVAKPCYTKSEEAKGTIIAQFPEGGTSVYEDVTLYLIVSNGSEETLVTVPGVEGLSISALQKKINEGTLIFDITPVNVSGKEKGGIVKNQEIPGGNAVSPYTRVSLSMTVKDDSSASTRQGVMETNLPEFLYPMLIKLVETDSYGHTKTLINSYHTGGHLTLPYEASNGSTLRLYVRDELVNETVIR